MAHLISTYIDGEDLQEYAATLIDAGFTVSIPEPRKRYDGTPLPQRWFYYERDGFAGTVERTDFEGYRHSMPIKPSREYGSGLITNGEDHKWELRLEDAEKTARAENRAIYNYGTTRNPDYPTFKNNGVSRHWDGRRITLSK